MRVGPEPAEAQYREILRFVRRRVPAAADAEDLTQDVFANAANALARSSDGAVPTLGWLYTVANRRLADRARRRRVETVPLEAAAEPAAPDNPYGDLVARTFEAALRTMPEGQRAVVVPRLLEGRSFAEIATHLRLREDACRVRFMRGLQHLRGEFEKEGLTP